MRIEGLAGGMGVELHGVDLRRGSSLADLSRPEGREGIDRLRAEWDRRHLILVRGPLLSGEEQLAFVARFGHLVAERRPWAYVSNVRPDGIVREGALLFHSDFAFTCAPTSGISLHALEVPDDGAPTLFADAVRAAKQIPADLRRRLEDALVLNVYDFSGSDDRRMREQGLAPGSPTYVHPVIGLHGRTGEAVIYANQLHSDRIVGVSDADSEALLTDLFAVLYDDANVMTHHWRTGDLVLWDNVALHHARRTIPLKEPRTLQRVTLGDYTPAELVPNLAELLAAR